MGIANKIQTLLDLATADGAGDYKPFSRGNDGTPITANGEVEVFGVWDGATVKFTKKAIDSKATPTQYDIPILDGAVELAVISNRMIPLELLEGEEIRAVVSGAGAGTELTAILYEKRGT